MIRRTLLDMSHDIEIARMHDAHVEAQRINRDLAILKAKRDGSLDSFLDRLALQRQLNDGSVA